MGFLVYYISDYVIAHRCEEYWFLYNKIIDTSAISMHSLSWKYKGDMPNGYTKNFDF